MFGEYDSEIMGKYLVKLRGEMPRSTAAKLSKISNSYLRSLEKGYHPSTGKPIKASPETLIKLAEAYNVDPNNILTKANYVSGQLRLFSKSGSFYSTVEETKELYDIQLKTQENDIEKLFYNNNYISFNGKRLDMADKQKILDMLPILLRSSNEEI
ncbi:helix-turn-helix domain-containing protein [Paenibacillus odorifer]|uniref:helix-turn-helix domain-containing protein n=1 Tax=Paenibacillus odorifer TaxID=189426 RepID=UPI00096D0D9C|nr:helix-turn-helix transcriptional regulator [Paenibacillus odorifer]OMD67613.1 hypothetical protein BSK50_30045 [Paenibacillus odorifer]